MFHVLPKHHVFWHMCLKCKMQHPRLGATLQDEDYMGRIKGIVVRSSAGLQLHCIPHTVVQKMLWGKELLLTYGC